MNTDFKNSPVIIDSDTANEADDQFALVYAALSPNIDLRAVLTAPFSNGRERDPSRGIGMSIAEAEKYLGLAGASVPVLEGSRSFMPDTATAVPSPAADHLVNTLRGLPEGERITVCAIGCGTNIASALLTAPDIADKMILVWQAGHVPECPEGGEFNLCGDVNAARVILASHVPLVLIPAYGSASEMLVSVGELRRGMAGKSNVGDALYGMFCEYIGAAGDGTDDERQKIIWDIASVGVLAGVPVKFEEHPRRVRLDDESFIEGDGTLTVCRGIDRDALVGDMLYLIGGAR
ncbi:MAG: nucleoside hydrolase [Clostridia bacterium]|nr:nucleoside hydrolase [Clostridia bacterium]